MSAAKINTNDAGAIENEAGPSPALKPRRRALDRVSDDVAGHWGGQPRYVILADAGYPGSESRRLYPAIPVGLKKRRSDEVRVEKTFSVQGADESLVEDFKEWCRTRGYTIKSAFDVALAEFLKKHS